jgi:predicted TIM-barrel fold metal-dependent hydrolase
MVLIDDVNPSEEELQSLPSLVSVDDHVCEPPLLWQERIPKSSLAASPSVHRERVPSVISPGSEVWADVWHYEDVRLPVERSGASVGMPPTEFDLEPMTFDDMRAGCCDPTSRLLDMDADGVEASVCFPNLFVRFCGQRFLEARDKELALLCVRAYNDWLIDEWSGSSGGRLVPSAIIPLWDVDLSVQEVHRNSARGCKAVCFSEIPARLGLPSMYSGYWEPFFLACAETGTVINMHIGSSSKVHTTSEDAPLAVRISNHFGNCSFSLSDWLLSGTLLRHPSLKIAFSEGQAGWVPYLMSRLDGMWGKKGSPTNNLLPDRPSSYLRDHVYFCIFDDPAVLRYLDVVGEDNICFETDYPHPDGSWPNSRASAYRQTASLTSDQRDKVLRTNAARLYSIERVSAPTG